MSALDNPPDCWHLLWTASCRKVLAKFCAKITYSALQEKYFGAKSKKNRFKTAQYKKI